MGVPKSRGRRDAARGQLRGPLVYNASLKYMHGWVRSGTIRRDLSTFVHFASDLMNGDL